MNSQIIIGTALLLSLILSWILKLSMQKGDRMRDIKCSDCAEYRNEWCEKVIDSPHPDILRDCQYFHDKDRDVIKVIRCKDCKHYKFSDNRAFGFPVKRCEWTGFEDVDDDDFCSRAERRQE